MMSNVMGTELISRPYFPKKVHSIQIPARRTGGTIQITADEISTAGFAIPTRVSQAIRRVSQLGLKEIWLGGAPGDHNRGDHSVGTFNVGFFWLKTLQEDRRVPAHCLGFPLDTWVKIRAVLGTALLLHDYGHLPFAHMTEEVLRSINWLPSARVPGLEAAVLGYRCEVEPDLTPTWQSLLNTTIGLDTTITISSNEIRAIVEQLILGTHSAPWLQAIANSSIDADKIDYLRFDGEFIRDKAFPVRHRLLQDEPTQWLADCLSDQDVNHFGLLCLHGRSAVAAADLWRERIFLYDRLYLAPELRVPERIAFEIVAQFIIRSAMSGGFLEKAGMPKVRGLAALDEASSFEFTVAFGGSSLLQHDAHSHNLVLRITTEGRW
jgi:HD superfamily phosphohydrolase